MFRMWIPSKNRTKRYFYDLQKMQASPNYDNNQSNKGGKMIEITCIECGDKFDKFTGDMDERTCLTCVLKNEDPEVIKEDR